MAAAGSAVGLGNIWKFPFEAGAGGGAAFLLMYLAFCFILCFPVMVTEIAIGRKTRLNPVGAFRALGHKRWSIIGKMGVISGVLILSFYNVVAGWAFGYFIEMALGNFDIGAQFGSYITNVVKIGGYAVVFMVATAYIVSKGISAGIEKASKILMPTLFLIIISLVVYSFTLPHALNGIKFYLVPDFSEITPEVVFNALGQAFFSLSLGMGALITYGSYVGKDDNIITSAVFITLADVGIAFLAGLMMFPFVAYLTEGTMEGAAQGPGLIFTVLPGVFESLGSLPGVIIGSVFFLLLSFAALTSTVSLLEVPVTYVVDEYDIKRSRAVWLVAVVIFMVGLPSLLGNGAVAFFTAFITYPSGETKTFMDVVENISSDTFLPLGGFMISVFAAYFWKKENLHEEICSGFDGFKTSPIRLFLDLTISYLCPLILGIIFILTVSQKFFGINLIEQLF